MGLMDAFAGPALIWLGIAVVAAIVEVSIPHFGFVFVSGAAVAAAIAAALSAGVPLQVVVFTVVLVVSFAALRPWVVRRMSSRGVPSRTEQLIGKDGLVTQGIDPVVGAGRVNVGGEDWMARSLDALAPGTRVRVVGADGIVLEVRRV